MEVKVYRKRVVDVVTTRSLFEVLQVSGVSFSTRVEFLGENKVVYVPYYAFNRAFDTLLSILSTLDRTNEDVSLERLLDIVGNYIGLPMEGHPVDVSLVLSSGGEPLGYVKNNNSKTVIVLEDSFNDIKQLVPMGRKLSISLGIDFEHITIIAPKAEDNDDANNLKEIPEVDIPEWISLERFYGVPDLLIRYIKSKFSPRNLVIFGPPGTGKTTLAQAILKELGYEKFILLLPSLFKNRWYGESTRRLRVILNHSEKEGIPVIIDDAEYLSSRSNGVNNDETMSSLTEILSHTTRNKTPLVLLANRIEHLDPALIRPGRMDAIILMLYPTFNQRIKYILDISRKYKVSMNKRVVETLARRMEYASLAELDIAVKYYEITRSVRTTIESIDIDKGNRERSVDQYIRYFNSLGGIKFRVPHIVKPTNEHLDIY